MATKKLTQAQKIDLILEAVTILKSNVSELKTDMKVVKREVHDMSTVVLPDLINVAGNSRDRLEAVENHLAKQSPFTPFTTGAFAA